MRYHQPNVGISTVHLTKDYFISSAAICDAYYDIFCSIWNYYGEKLPETQPNILWQPFEDMCHTTQMHHIKGAMLSSLSRSIGAMASESSLWLTGEDYN